MGSGHQTPSDDHWTCGNSIHRDNDERQLARERHVGRYRVRWVPAGRNRPSPLERPGVDSQRTCGRHSAPLPPFERLVRQVRRLCLVGAIWRKAVSEDWFVAAVEQVARAGRQACAAIELPSTGWRAAAMPEQLAGPWSRWSMSSSRLAAGTFVWARPRHSASSNVRLPQCAPGWFGR